MSRTQVVQVQSVYTPIKDAMQRHENGVTKNRKAPLTGSGRAWREDEVITMTMWLCAENQETQVC